MTIYELLQLGKENVGWFITAFTATSILVEFTPIKLNPLGTLLGWIGSRINGGLSIKMDALADQVSGVKIELDEFKRESEQKTADDWRWYILGFANSCRNDCKHTREEWNHVIAQLDLYDDYTSRKRIKNGVISAEAKYLKKLYQERLEENDFL